jgi:DNA-binding NarL/FixJ family response regulator
MAARKRIRRGPGGSPLSAKRERYFRLMKQGFSNSEACRTVGVHRRTGSRWRYGRTVVSERGAVYDYAPVALLPDPTPVSDRYLSEEERVVIADGLNANTTMTDIASALGRSTSTVSREVKRNSDPATGKYRPSQAQRRETRVLVAAVASGESERLVAGLAETQYEVVWAESIDEFFTLAAENQPDIVALGHDACNMVERVSEVAAILPLAAIIVLFDVPDEAELLAIFHGGARGYLPMTISTSGFAPRSTQSLSASRSSHGR